jgi:hypothetical protein
MVSSLTPRSFAASAILNVLISGGYPAGNPWMRLQRREKTASAVFTTE